MSEQAIPIELQQMTLKEFMDELNRMNMIWPGVTQKERVGRYANAVKHLTARQWKTVVDELIDTSEFKPLPAKVKELASRYQSQNYYDAMDLPDERGVSNFTEELRKRGYASIFDFFERTQLNKGKGSDGQKKD